MTEKRQTRLTFCASTKKRSILSASSTKNLNPSTSPENCDFYETDVDDDFNVAANYNIEGGSNATEFSSKDKLVNSGEQSVSTEEEAVTIGIEEVTSTKRRKHKISNAWHFLAKLDSIHAKCNVCFKTYSHHGNTQNLRKHLLNNHPSVFNCYASQDIAKANNEGSPTETVKCSKSDPLNVSIKSFFSCDTQHKKPVLYSNDS